jgi:dTDP-4-amino-4,6-dideoxygalactose transaminase
MKFLDLHWQYSPFKEQIINSFMDVFENTRFVNNKSVKELEEKFAKMNDSKYAVAVSSGTAAIHVSLMALDLKSGDEVITTPFTFIATSNAIKAVGAKPVYVDIDPETFNINPDLIEEKINPNTKAIIPVHLYGHPADLNGLMQIAEKHNLSVIEDCAQAHLAEHSGKKVGTFGEMGCFSLYPGKNLGAFGEGGMIITNDESLVKILRQKGNNGINPEGPKYFNQTTGLNCRMNELTAAIMLNYIDKLPEWNLKREKNASLYNEKLSQIQRVITPSKKPNIKHVYHQYVIRTKKRDSLKAHLKEKGFPTDIHYPNPLHLMPAYAYLGYKKGDFPESEKAADEVLSLPIGPHLSRQDLLQVVSEIKNFFAENQDHFEGQ